jgi:NAD(P)-dependent dehydrogenase (short-subunit alcohol dehydrogenase family)
VALVTGAGSGIGLATVAKLRAHGWGVLAMDKRFAEAEFDDLVERMPGDVSAEEASTARSIAPSNDSVSSTHWFSTPESPSPVPDKIAT